MTTMTVHPLVVPEPQVIRKTRSNLLTSAGIYRCIQEEILGARYGQPCTHQGFFEGQIPFDELIAEDDIEGGRKGRDRRARYELRYRKIALSEAGLLSSDQPLTEAGFRYNQVCMPIHHMRQTDLLREQPGCDWWIVAFYIEKKRMDMASEVWRDVLDARTVSREFGGNLDAAKFQHQDADRTEPEPAFGYSSVPKIDQIEDWHFVVHLAWADVSGADLMDTVTSQHERDGAKESHMAEYADTRNLRSLTAGMRKNRDDAKRVILKYNEIQRLLGAESPQIGEQEPDDRIQILGAKATEMRTRGTPLPAIAKSLKLPGGVPELKGLLADYERANGNGQTP